MQDFWRHSLLHFCLAANGMALGVCISVPAVSESDMHTKLSWNWHITEKVKDSGSLMSGGLNVKLKGGPLKS